MASAAWCQGQQWAMVIENRRWRGTKFASGPESSTEQVLMLLHSMSWRCTLHLSAFQLMNFGQSSICSWQTQPHHLLGINNLMNNYVFQIAKIAISRYLPGCTGHGQTGQDDS